MLSNPTANCATTFSVFLPASKTSASMGSRSVVIKPSMPDFTLSTIRLFGGATGSGYTSTLYPRLRSRSSASPISQVAKTRKFLFMSFLVERTSEMNCLDYITELPACGFADEVLLPQTKHHTRTHRKDRFLHREDVCLHSLHVKLVFALIGRKKLAARGNVGNFGYAFDNDRFMRVFRTHDAFGVLRQVARLARLAAGAEQEPAVLPQAPDHHGVR